MTEQISQLKKEVREELTRNILHFWSTQMVDPGHGGFYGQITGEGTLAADAPKGGILNARILWTFSSAYLHLKDPAYLEMANRAKAFIADHFFDPEYGGTYWTIAATGEPQDLKKQIYSQAFFMYALSEHYRATGDETSLQQAIGLFELIEKHSFDPVKNGYLEAYSRDWQLLDDLRLSEKDANEKKTMNTHLHVLEAYTNLYRVWKDPRLAHQLENLILIFTEKITDPDTHHLKLFFDEDWNTSYSLVSYGHDIEASWLIDEAARILGNKILLRTVQSQCVQIAEAACEGLQSNGGLIYEYDQATGHTDGDFHWWVQAEAVVGFVNAFELTGDAQWLRKAEQTWWFIRENLIDREQGEWFWSLTGEGIQNRDDDKAGFWKCPYHNSRMCLELIAR